MYNKTISITEKHVTYVMNTKQHRLHPFVTRKDLTRPSVTLNLSSKQTHSAIWKQVCRYVFIFTIYESNIACKLAFGIGFVSTTKYFKFGGH